MESSLSSISIYVIAILVCLLIFGVYYRASLMNDNETSTRRCCSEMLEQSSYSSDFNFDTVCIPEPLPAYKAPSLKDPPKYDSVWNFLSVSLVSCEFPAICRENIRIKHDCLYILWFGLWTSPEDIPGTEMKLCTFEIPNLHVDIYNANTAANLYLHLPGRLQFQVLNKPEWRVR